MMSRIPLDHHLGYPEPPVRLSLHRRLPRLWRNNPHKHNLLHLPGRARKRRLVRTLTLNRTNPSQKEQGNKETSKLGYPTRPLHVKRFLLEQVGVNNQHDNLLRRDEDGARAIHPRLRPPRLRPSQQPNAHPLHNPLLEVLRVPQARQLLYRTAGLRHKESLREKGVEKVESGADRTNFSLICANRKQDGLHGQRRKVTDQSPLLTQRVACYNLSDPSRNARLGTER